jgi:uncharacterized Zn finger protein
MARHRYWDDFHYTPIREKQDKAKRSQAQLTKARGTLQPVVVTGRSLAASWWGKAWAGNLERYSDYSNRLPRGRSYLHSGMVLHLAIEPGKIEALVQGSRPQPYAVSITVAALSAARWTKAKAACSGQLDSLQALLRGEFPDALKELFMVQGGGLFPAPSEIQFDCTCPDWASMCKHVAAVLYGVGVRLDADPRLFFTLRQVSIEDLVAKALRGTSRTLLEKAGQAAGGALADADLGAVFGIDLDDAPAAAAEPTKAKAAPTKAPTKAKAAPTKAKAAPTKAKAAPAPRRGQPHTEEAKQRLQKARMIASLQRAIRALEAEDDGDTTPAARRSATPPAATPPAAARAPLQERLLAALRGKRAGLAVPAIMRATGFTEMQARNAVARAMTLGRLTSPRRGVYALVQE